MYVLLFHYFCYNSTNRCSLYAYTVSADYLTSMGGQSDNQKYQITWKINERDEQQVGSIDSQSHLCS